MGAALAVDWTAIKEAMIAGVPATELAKRFSLLKPNGSPDTTAIRKRCSREKWPVPTAIMDRASRKLAAARHQARQASRDISTEGVQNAHVTPSHDPRDITSDEVLRYWKRTQMALLPPLTEQAELAVTENPSHFKPKNLKEMTQLVGIAAKLTGADRPQSAVQVNLWGQGSGSQAGPDALDCTEIDVDAS